MELGGGGIPRLSINWPASVSIRTGLACGWMLGTPHWSPSHYSLLSKGILSQENLSLVIGCLPRNWYSCLSRSHLSKTCERSYLQLGWAYGWLKNLSISNSSTHSQKWITSCNLSWSFHSDPFAYVPWWSHGRSVWARSVCVLRGSTASGKWTAGRTKHQLLASMMIQTVMSAFSWGSAPSSLHFGQGTPSRCWCQGTDFLERRPHSGSWGCPHSMDFDWRCNCLVTFTAVGTVGGCPVWPSDPAIAITGNSDIGSCLACRSHRPSQRGFARRYLPLWG